MPRTLMYEMDDARKEKFKRVGEKIVDLLKAEMDGPGESFMLLNLIYTAWKEHYGIEGGISFKDDQVGHA
jgi:hypothetical protein